MQIFEMFNENPKGYASEKEDNSTPTLKDLRKTKLTLRQINRLRIMNDIRKLEHETKVDAIKTQYKSTASEESAL